MDSCFKGWIRRWIFSLSIFGGLLKHSETRLKPREIEQSLYDYANISGLKLSWKWKYPNVVCVMYRPNNFSVLDTNHEMMQVTLESLQCQKIDMEVLTCMYEREEKVETADDDKENHQSGPRTKELYFANGLNGELYAMVMPLSNTRCSQPHSLVIDKCVNDGVGQPKDFADVEESILENISRINTKKWISMHFTCRLLCPGNLYFARTARLEFVKVALTSLDGRKIWIRVLKCYFNNSESNVPQLTQSDGLWFHYMRDIYGEVYELLRDPEEAQSSIVPSNVFTIFTIQRRVIDRKGRLVRLLCDEPNPISLPLPPLSPVPSSHDSDWSFAE